MARGDPERPAREGRNSKATQDWNLALGILWDSWCDCFHLLLESHGNQPAKYVTPWSKLFPQHLGLYKNRSHSWRAEGSNPTDAGHHFPGNARNNIGSTSGIAIQFSCR